MSWASALMASAGHAFASIRAWVAASIESERAAQVRVGLDLVSLLWRVSMMQLETTAVPAGHVEDGEVGECGGLVGEGGLGDHELGVLAGELLGGFVHLREFGVVPERFVAGGCCHGGGSEEGEVFRELRVSMDFGVEVSERDRACKWAVGSL